MDTVPRKKISKRQVALNHIHAAIELWPTNTYEVSIIHLAAAAEEILGAMLKRESKRTMLEKFHATLEQHGMGVDRKVAYKAFTKSKNDVKHADVPEDDEVTYSDVEPLLVLLRAIYNYEALVGQTTPQMAKFMTKWRPSLRLVNGNKGNR